MSHKCSDLKCTSCENPGLGEAILLRKFQDAMRMGMPVIRPILVDPGYMFTIGMRQLAANCKGELVMTVIDTQIGAQVLMHVSTLIQKGLLKPETWEQGTLLSSDTLGMPVSLQVHLLGDTCITKYLGSSRRSFLKLPVSDLAYQLIWPDEQNKYPAEHVAKQTFLR